MFASDLVELLIDTPRDHPSTCLQAIKVNFNQLESIAIIIKLSQCVRQVRPRAALRSPACVCLRPLRLFICLLRNYRAMITLRQLARSSLRHKRMFCSKHTGQDGRKLYEVDHFAALVDSPDTRTRIESILRLHRHVLRAPNTLSPEDMVTLIESSHGGETVSALRYLWKRELRHEKQLQRQIDNLMKPRPQLIDGIIDEATQTPIYGIFNNAMMSVTHNVKKQIYPNLLKAAQFGQPLVIDFSYDHLMSLRGHVTLANQVQLLISHNRRQLEPMDIHFCNYRADPRFDNELHKSMNVRSPDELLVTSTESSYLQLFPKERLVYLSPHAEEELSQFDDDAIYVIGAFVDKLQHIKDRHSFHKSCNEGVRSLKLPLDDYLDMRSGTNTCLNVDHVAKIMIDLSNGSSLHDCLERHVPSRKQHTANDEMRKLRKQRIREKRKAEIEYLKRNTEVSLHCTAS